MGRGAYTEHSFYCIKCGNKGIPLMRNQGFKQRHHRKKLYCPFCKQEVNHIECSNLDDVEEFVKILKMGCIDEAKNLYLMCGPAGSGKTTWVNAQMANAACKCIHISRDVVRNTFLTDEDKNMFAYEDDVCLMSFCCQVEAAIEDESGADAIFVDATHLSEKARNRVLDKLNLENVDIYPVVFNLPLYQILNQE